MCAGWGWAGLLSCNVVNFNILHWRYRLCNVTYPKGRQNGKLLKKGHLFCIAINWWFLFHHCNFKTPSRSALISVTNICQQQFSSHLYKENNVGGEVFWFDFWSYLYTHISTYSYYLKKDEKQCLKANLVRSTTNFTCVGNEFLSHWLFCQIAVQLLDALHESCGYNSIPINFHILNWCSVAVSMGRSSNCGRSCLRI